MSRRKANLEHEYSLEREIKDLKDQLAKLKKKLRETEKSAIKEEPEVKPKAKPQHKECPKCGAKLKEAELPMGVLELCEAACGFRNVRRKK
jgi:DNA repair exonuclease SbcCD ATPase subunit